VLSQHNKGFSVSDLQQACLLARALSQAEDVSLCFPIRLTDLGPSFLTRLESVLAATDLPPTQLELALAAESFTNLSSTCHQRLTGVSYLGAGLSLYGFGGKGASLECFEAFDFTSVFLNPSITAGLARPLQAPHYPLLLLSGMLAVAAILGTTVVVRAITSVEMMERFASLGCLIQTGSIFGAPTPLGSTPNWSIP
jgi:EAL domain-containing protein (putative c-di-GMP-specific phosphodiesterase class I)